MGILEENIMNTKMVEAKYEVIFLFDIMLGEKVSKDISVKWEGLGEAVIHAPELLDPKKLKEGSYRSKLLVDVTLDTDARPAEVELDVFFVEKCTQALVLFLFEAWHYSSTPAVDPFIHPIYISCQYYDLTGSAFVNPDTGKSSYERQYPRGIILDRQDWDAIINNLATGKVRDLAERILLEARCLEYTNRFEIAILVAAMACEYKVKSVCTRLARKKGVPNEFWDMLVDKIRPPVWRYYEDIIVVLGMSPMSKSLSEKLKQLFSHRNKIAHFGTIRGYSDKQLTGKEIQALAGEDIQTAEQFVSWLDSQEVAIS
jgi:hypothetical protein